MGKLGGPEGLDQVLTLMTAHIPSPTLPPLVGMGLGVKHQLNQAAGPEIQLPMLAGF